MKSFIIYSYLFLTNLWNSLISLLLISFKNNIWEVNKLRNLGNSINKLSTIRILGNGNSLTIDDIWKDESSVDYMVVNRHVLSETYKEVQPRYYVLADPFFFNCEKGRSILEDIRSNTNWDMLLVVPYRLSRIIMLRKFFFSNHFIQIISYNSEPFKGFSLIKNYLYRINLSIPRAQNVIVAGIYFAICLGYKRIELFGVEHSWIQNISVNKENQVCLKNPHFFDEKEPLVKTWKEIQGDEAKLHEVLRLYAYMFEAYWDLRRFSEDIGNVEIINCTNNSYIDAFNRL
jgi:hypothetical protein